jgi:hypothetical protein
VAPSAQLSRSGWPVQLRRWGNRITVTIELPPEIEAGIMAQAEAEGLPVSEYLRNLVKGQVSARIGERKAFEIPPEGWVRQFKAWVASHAEDDLPVLSDEALSREFIYSERGL